MAYCEWHGSLPKHHKTAWLMESLGIPRYGAVGIRGCLYGYCIENRPGGYIERSILAYACEWEGDKNALEKALIDAKLVDEIDEQTVYVHDWPEYTRGFKKAKKDAARLKRKRRATVARQSPTIALPSRDCRGDLNRAERSRTEQSGSELNRAEEEEKRAPRPPAAILVPPEWLKGLELYERDPKLIKAWNRMVPAWQQTFPGIDILAEVRKAHTWELSDPTRRKKQRVAFLTRWFTKAQDQASRNYTGGANAQRTAAPVGEHSLKPGDLEKMLSERHAREAAENAGGDSAGGA